MSHHKSFQARQRIKGKHKELMSILCQAYGEGPGTESRSCPLTGCLLQQPLEGWVFLNKFEASVKIRILSIKPISLPPR